MVSCEKQFLIIHIQFSEIIIRYKKLVIDDIRILPGLLIYVFLPLSTPANEKII